MDEGVSIYGTIAELLWKVISGKVMDSAQFARYMEAYYQARLLEEGYVTTGEAAENAETRIAAPACGPARNDGKNGDTSSVGSAPAGANVAVSIVDTGELAPQPAPEPDKPMLRKKRRILAELQARRETGTGLQDIVDAGGGRFDMTVLLSALEARYLTVAQWDDIDRALKKAKKAGAGEGE